MESMETMKRMMEISIFEVFEKMFFIFLEHSSDGNNHYDYEASITFSGTVRGEIRLFVSHRVARAMVVNMLGIEEGEITEKDIEDCSKEAVNMICGNLLGKLNNHEETFELAIPLYHRSSLGITTDSNTTSHSHFKSDDGAMSAALRIYVD